jgi:exopolysaccharide production protein ExoQ
LSDAVKDPRHAAWAEPRRQPDWLRLLARRSALRLAEADHASGSPTLMALVIAIALVSCGNINPAIFGPPEAVVELGQKLAGAVFWLLAIGVTFLPGVRRRPPPTAGLLLPAVLVVWAVSSVAWSNQPASSIEKAAVLAFTTFGAWRLASSLRCDTLFRLLFWSLLLLVLGSVAAAVFVPSIGVLRTWQHAGQWSGLFVSKQTLGTVSASLVFLSLLRLCYAVTPAAILGLVAGIAAVIGAGSRGGAVMAVAAVVCVLVARRSARLAGAISYLPAVTLGLASAGIAILVGMDLPYFPFFGTEIDLTDRTVIWHYALSGWTERPLLGFGIQGFWTDPLRYELFEQTHGWVLDNFHSGYVALLVEQGLLGYLLFAGFVLVLCRRLRLAILGAARLDPGARFGIEATFGYVILSFTINLTETFFFRATDFAQVTVALATITLFTAPGPAPAPRA